MTIGQSKFGTLEKLYPGSQWLAIIIALTPYRQKYCDPRTANFATALRGIPSITIPSWKLAVEAGYVLGQMTFES